MAKVFLGMSGGVDSSVSAILLKEQGYDVIGVYMKNWSKDLPGMKCPWAEDLADAKRVAVGLDIDFEVWDFEADYKQKVVDYMLSEFQKGRTPNPDVMCNQEIKFKLFYEKALARGADFIATGHYARVGTQDGCIYGKGESFSEGIRSYGESRRSPREESVCTFFRGDARESERSEEEERVSPVTTGADDAPQGKLIHPCLDATLLRAKDENKDQTYFLYRMSNESLAHTLFPLGNMLKPEVKAFAAARGLDVAQKKESMGVCFVGDVGMKDFLREYLPAAAGEIRELESDAVLGYHDGAHLYTIGQRHGLYLGGGLPFYVVKKDLARNIVYVSKNLNHESLWTDQLALEDLHLRNQLTVKDLTALPDLKVRLRHRAELVPAQVVDRSKDEHDVDMAGLTISFAHPIKRPAAGQSAVFYAGEACLGGGIVAE